MEVIKKYKTQLYFHLFLNLTFGLFVVLASFSHYPMNDFKSIAVCILHALTLQFTVFGFLYLLSLNRWIFFIVFPPLFLLFSIAGFWVYTQDIAISHDIIRLAFETNHDVVSEIISIPFLINLLAAIVATSALLKYRNKMPTNQTRSPLLILAILGIACFYTLENFKYGIFKRRLPYNLGVAVDQYIKTDDLKLKPITGSLLSNAETLNIVFVLGETVRADHMQLNGYHRATNPLLVKRKNLISFPNTFTPMTYTAESLQQLLTDASFKQNARPKLSLIEVLNHAGIQTQWIGNQTPEVSYRQFIQQCQTQTILDPLHAESSFKKAYDEEMLPEFRTKYQSHKKQFTVLHMMGSHWWYETRYPDAFRKYTPVIKNKFIGSNTQQEMINSYDNTILYLDYFLDQTLREIEKYDSETLLIYLSDHGEMLGENDQWLHAQQGKAVSNPAMLIWYSNRFAKNHPQIIEIWKNIRNNKTDLDFLFPSIIDAFGIEGIPYESDKSIFR